MTFLTSTPNSKKHCKSSPQNHQKEGEIHLKSLKCMDNKYKENQLTVDKEYPVLLDLSATVVIENDNGIEETYSKLRFSE